MRRVTSLFVDRALLPIGWFRDVRIVVGPNGRISAVHTDSKPEADDERLSGKVLLPAPANLHSHAFQRSLAGLGEHRSTSQDDFWSWREFMYGLVALLTPEDIEIIAALVQMEMLESGYAAVGEFHYLHHQPDGSIYDNIGTMGSRIVAAAARTGIGLTLLPALYSRGGLDGRALSSGQRRFGCDRDRFEAVLGSCLGAISGLDEDSTVGVAAHSLRAVSPGDLTWASSLLPGAPVHLHIAEQEREVDEVSAAYGRRPMSWLMENHEVDQRWCLVHATHVTAKELHAMANSGAVVGLCPITESNLGDGIYEAVEFMIAGGRIGIGSDSNVRISLSEELRTLEYSQRLSRRGRGQLAPKGGSVGRALFDACSHGGSQAIGRASGAIAEGRLADFVALDGNALALSGVDGDRLLDAWIFAADDRLVRDVFSAGRHVVSDGRHVDRDTIVTTALPTLRKLRQLL